MILYFFSIFFLSLIGLYILFTVHSLTLFRHRSAIVLYLIDVDVEIYICILKMTGPRKDRNTIKFFSICSKLICWCLGKQIKDFIVSLKVTTLIKSTLPVLLLTDSQQYTLSTEQFVTIYHETYPVMIKNKSIDRVINCYIWVILLGQLYQLPICVSMKGKFVANVLFDTVRLINLPWDRIKSFSSLIKIIPQTQFSYRRESGVWF